MSALKAWIHAVLWLLRHWRGQYQAEESVVISPMLARDDVCVDIGAHAGSWTRPLARLVPAGRVYAFEALPHYAVALRRLMLLTFTGNVTVINAAMSDQPGTVQIAWRTKAGRKLTGNTHMATSSESGEVECVTVTALTLDGWHAALPSGPKVGFVKIDVEGAELLVLRGAKAFLQKNRPVIFMEIVTECCARYGYIPADLFRLFGELGYRSYMVKVGRNDGPLQPASADNYPGKGDVLLLPVEHPANASMR